MKNKKFYSILELVSLKGKSVIITGAGKGIGKAITWRLAEAGAHLILLDIDQQSLENLKTELVAKNYLADIFKVDLSMKKEIDDFWQNLGDRSIHVLINNAGFYPFKDFLEVNEEYYKKVMDVNLNSAYWMCHHLVQRNKKKGGKIINIGSIEAMLPFKENLTHYSIAKAGVVALTRSLAKEYGKYGFNINALLPGGIVTDGTKGIASEFLKFKFNLLKDWVNFRARLPLKRLGQPDEVARMVLVLASDLSSYVNGALVPVDGGFLSA